MAAAPIPATACRRLALILSIIIAKTPGLGRKLRLAPTLVDPAFGTFDEAGEHDAKSRKDHDPGEGGVGIQVAGRTVDEVAEAAGTHEELGGDDAHQAAPDGEAQAG